MTGAPGGAIGFLWDGLLRLPVDLNGLPPFTQTVLELLRQVPPGHPRALALLEAEAKELGVPLARATGAPRACDPPGEPAGAATAPDAAAPATAPGCRVVPGLDVYGAEEMGGPVVTAGARRLPSCSSAGGVRDRPTNSARRRHGDKERFHTPSRTSAAIAGDAA